LEKILKMVKPSTKPHHTIRNSISGLFSPFLATSSLCCEVTPIALDATPIAMVSNYTKPIADKLRSTASVEIITKTTHFVIKTADGQQFNEIENDAPVIAIRVPEQIDTKQSVLNFFYEHALNLISFPDIVKILSVVGLIFLCLKIERKKSNHFDNYSGFSKKFGLDNLCIPFWKGSKIQKENNSSIGVGFLYNLGSLLLTGIPTGIFSYAIKLADPNIPLLYKIMPCVMSVAIQLSMHQSWKHCNNRRYASVLLGARIIIALLVTID
jgi:hypothetical protein